MLKSPCYLSKFGGLDMESKVLAIMVIAVFAWSTLLLLVTGGEIGVDEVLGALAGAVAGALLVALISLAVKRRRERGTYRE